MPKRTNVSEEMEIALDTHASLPLYRQLYDRLRMQILAGQLAAGARLPSTRVLAAELGISRTTTALAYEYLLLEGYIESRVGDGTRVACLWPERQSEAAAFTPVPDPSEAAPHAGLARRGQLLANTPFPEAIYADRTTVAADLFGVGQPDVAHFPYETWARLIAKHARRYPQALSYDQKVQGYLPLREVIAAHIGVTRGVHCTSEQIMLTTGAQGALDLVARILLDPGDVAWIEDPGYGGARGALLAAGARLVAVPLDGEGIDVEAGQARCRDARLAIVTPSHQFPTGITMSLGRRLALLAWARQARAWIVEDDYDSEYRFSGRPLEALQGLDHASRVIYIGTLSKILFPSTRIGYVVVPPTLVDSFFAARRFFGIHAPLLEQMALADFFAEGHFARYVRKMRGRYLERRNALVDALTREMGDTLIVCAPDAGMHLVAWLPTGMDGRAVVRDAAAHGLHIQPVSQFREQPGPCDGLVLGFAGNAPDALREGVRTLARILRMHAT